MPPFRLELPDYKPMDNRMTTSLYFKRIYGPSVKITGWENYPESRPIDNDPYCPEGLNLHYSHYNRLGSDEEKYYTTTTQDMLEQIHNRNNELENSSHKRLVNLFTEIGNVDCNASELNEVCPLTSYNEEYITTMQHSYQPPYPVKLKRISMPQTPYFLNRRLTNNGMCKFLDDDFTLHTKRLQYYKSHKHISYNPGTGYFSDGSNTRFNEFNSENLMK